MNEFIKTYYSILLEDSKNKIQSKIKQQLNPIEQIGKLSSDDIFKNSFEAIKQNFYNIEKKAETCQYLKNLFKDMQFSNQTLEKIQKFVLLPYKAVKNGKDPTLTIEKVGKTLGKIALKHTEQVLSKEFDKAHIKIKGFNITEEKLLLKKNIKKIIFENVKNKKLLIQNIEYLSSKINSYLNFLNKNMIIHLDKINITDFFQATAT